MKKIKYNPWLWANKSIYNIPITKILSVTLQEAENLVDKNVSPIKKLVKDISDIKKLVHKEHNFFLYDGIDLITHTFFTEVNKKIQSYGMISI